MDNVVFVRITLAILLLLITLLYFIYKRKRRRNKTLSFQSDSSETILTKIGYSFKKELTMEQNFIEYLCVYAQKRNIKPEISTEDLYNFFVRNYESARMSYVMETFQPLLINNLPRLLKKATKEFKKRKESKTIETSAGFIIEPILENDIRAKSEGVHRFYTLDENLALQLIRKKGNLYIGINGSSLKEVEYSNARGALFSYCKAIMPKWNPEKDYIRIQK